MSEILRGHGEEIDLSALDMADLRCGIVLQLKEIERLRTRVAELEQQIALASQPKRKPLDTSELCPPPFADDSPPDRKPDERSGVKRRVWPNGMYLDRCLITGAGNSPSRRTATTDRRQAVGTIEDRRKA